MRTTLPILGLVLSLGCVREVVPARPQKFRVRVEGETPRSEIGGAEHARGPRPWNAPATVTADRENPVLVQETVQTSDSDVLAPGDGVSPFEGNLIRNPDGTFTKFYFFRKGNPGAARVVESLLLRFLPEFAALKKDEDWWIIEDYVRDPRVPNPTQWKERSSPYGLPFGSSWASDLLVVTASEDLLREIDEFLERVLGDAPQIEIEITIVEVALDDLLSYGTKLTFARGSATETESSLIDDVTVDLAQNLVDGVIGNFSAIHDDSTINGLIELLQQTRHSEVLSSPKLATLNGHRAVIDTGSETPFLSPTFSSSGITSIATQFKPTGIRIVVTPFILTSDMVQLEIAAEVSAVTGFVTTGIGGGAEVENPLISRRNAYTVVNVPSGKTVLLGGLVTNDDMESVDKVPLLGDLPLIGYLFKRRSTTHRKAQVLFFVKPKIKVPDRASTTAGWIDEE